MTEQIEWTKTSGDWIRKTLDVAADPRALSGMPQHELRAIATGVDILVIYELSSALAKAARSPLPEAIQAVKGFIREQHFPALQNVAKLITDDSRARLTSAFAMRAEIYRQSPKMPESWREHIPSIIGEIVEAMSHPGNACGGYLAGQARRGPGSPQDRLDFAITANDICLTVWSAHFPHYGLRRDALGIKPASNDFQRAQALSIQGSPDEGWFYYLDLNNNRMGTGKLAHAVVHEPVHIAQGLWSLHESREARDESYGKWYTYNAGDGHYPDVLEVKSKALSALSPDSESQRAFIRAAGLDYISKPRESLPLYMGDAVGSILCARFGIPNSLIATENYAHWVKNVYPDRPHGGPSGLTPGRRPR